MSQHASLVESTIEDVILNFVGHLLLKRCLRYEFPKFRKRIQNANFSRCLFFYAEGFWNRLYVASFHMTGVMGSTFQGHQRSARMWETSQGDMGTPREGEEN